jgi:hypothetical protein
MPGIRHRRAIQVIALLLVGLGVVLALVALRPAVRNAWITATRCTLDGRLCGTALALSQYRDRYGELPPPVVDDPNGRVRHGWRMLVGEQIARFPSGEGFDPSSPWDSDVNMSVARRSMVAFVVPQPGGPTPEVEHVMIDDASHDDDEAGILIVEIVSDGADWHAPRRWTKAAIIARIQANRSKIEPFGVGVVFRDLARARLSVAEVLQRLGR